APARHPPSLHDARPSPIYRRPTDLIEVDLGQFSDSLKGRNIRGKVNGTKFVPDDDRSQLVTGSLAGRGLELAWAADPIEFFFLRSEEHTSELQSRENLV